MSNALKASQNGMLRSLSTSAIAYCLSYFILSHDLKGFSAAMLGYSVIISKELIFHLGCMCRGGLWNAEPLLTVILPLLRN